MKNQFIIILCFILSFSINLFSQTASKPKVTNPDISIIGDFAVKVSTDEKDPDINQLLIRSVELSFQGYLYPTVRADAFIALHRHEGELEIELCEGYLTFIKLINNFNSKIGKIHVDFGRINKLHEHSWPYVDAPLFMTTYLGHHGLVGTGGTLGYLMPVSDVFINIEAGAWRIPEHHHEEEEAETIHVTDINGNTNEVALYEEHHCSGFSIADKVYTGKIGLSFPIGQMNELSLGLSGLVGKGSHFTHHRDDVIAMNQDFQFKHYFRGTGYIVLQTEYFWLQRTVPVGMLKRNGLYSYLGVKWNKYWTTGVRGDYVESPMPGVSGEYFKYKTRSSVIITHNLTETFSIRGQYSYLHDLLKNNDKQKEHEAYLQIVWSIGPHTHAIE